MTAQYLLLEFIRRVDPRDVDGTEIVAGNLGSLDGQFLAVQRRLDIYNEARIVVVDSLLSALPVDEVVKLVGGTNQYEPVAWTVSGSVASIDKPSGYIKYHGLELDALSLPGPSRKVTLLEPSKLKIVRGGKNPHFIDSEANPYAFEIGSTFKHYGGYISNGGNGDIAYTGITDWTLANVTTDNPLPEETINKRYQPFLIQIATWIEEELGSIKVGQLSRKLLGADN